jgi:hypothetical protein
MQAFINEPNDFAIIGAETTTFKSRKFNFHSRLLLRLSRHRAKSRPPNEIFNRNMKLNELKY